MNRNLVFTAEKKDKKFEVTDKGYLEYIDSLKDGRYTLTIKRFYKKRTRSQNSYYWFIIDILGDHIGYEKDEMHEALKARFLSIVDEENGLLRVRSTQDLETIGMNEYIEKIRKFAAKDLSFYVPSPNEFEKIEQN